MWTPAWIAMAAVLGAAAGYVLRATIFHHSVEAGTPWRTGCPACAAEIVRPGWRLIKSRPGARCPVCRTRIGPPTGAIELPTAAVLALLAWRMGAHVDTLALAWAGTVGVALAFVDVAVHRLPDRLVATALIGTFAVLGLATALGTPYPRLLTAIACGLGAGAAYFLIVFVSASGMGLGDAKLAVLVGLTTGWFGVATTLYGVFLGFLLAGLTALTLLALRRVSRRDRIAHGPFMLLGALAAILIVHT